MQVLLLEAKVMTQDLFIRGDFEPYGPTSVKLKRFLNKINKELSE